MHGSTENTLDKADLRRRMAAAFGALTMLAMRDPRYRNYTIDDLRWIVEPAVLTGNFMIASGRKKEGGIPVPIGAVIWARVSELVDARLEEQKGKRPLRLSPEEMVGGRFTG